MNGWIKISRELPKHWIWQDAERLKWWLDLLLMASWDDGQSLSGGSRLIEIKRGQLVASISFLCQRWHKGHNTVIAFLKMLQEEKMITKETIGNTTIITICKYNMYQAADNLKDSLNSDIISGCNGSANNNPDNIADSPKDNLTDNIADTSKEIKNKRNIISNEICQNSEISELELAFESFRKAYPGSKRGHDVEFQNFKKKNPKTWREIVPLLMPALERMTAYRAAAKAAGEFVPQVANLSTWLNQSRWTTEYPEIKTESKLPEAQAQPTSKMNYSGGFGGMNY